MSEFKIGDQILKRINKIVDPIVYKIIGIKTIKGGNWHDGYSETIMATLLIDTFKEEYCIQYSNNMCQINDIFAVNINLL